MDSCFIFINSVQIQTSDNYLYQILPLLAATSAAGAASIFARVHVHVYLKTFKFVGQKIF